MNQSPNAIQGLLPILPNVLDQQSKPGISAQELYTFLGLNSAAWARWVKKNILTNPYSIEHIDWEGFQHDVENAERREKTSLGGRPRTNDYALSIDFAKRLAMMARSAKGEEARQYFLLCEKIVQENMVKAPLTAAEMFLAQAQMNVDFERRQIALEARQTQHESRQDALEAKVEDLAHRRPPLGKMTVFDWLRRHSMPHLPPQTLDAFKALCKSLEKPERFRPEGCEYPYAYFTIETIEKAYAGATRQLSLMQTSKGS